MDLEDALELATNVQLLHELESRFDHFTCLGRMDLDDDKFGCFRHSTGDNHTVLGMLQVEIIRLTNEFIGNMKPGEPG
jgi:hypothetical protein